MRAKFQSKNSIPKNKLIGNCQIFLDIIITATHTPIIQITHHYITKIKMQKQQQHNPTTPHQQKQPVAKDTIELAKQQQEEPQSGNPLLMNLQKEIEIVSGEIREMLTGENVNEIQVNGKVGKLLKLETRFHSIKELYLQEAQGKSHQLQEKTQDQQSSTIESTKEPTKEQSPQQEQFTIQHKLAILQKQSQAYEPSLQEIQQKLQTLQQQINDDGWTDATQSQTGTLNDDNLMVLDDDMLEQILGSLGEEEYYANQEAEKEEEEEENIDLNELEKEFVTGLESNEDFLFGKHEDDKFCVSVCSALKEGIVVSGGGDDKLYVYKWERNNVKQQQQKKGENSDSNKQPTKEQQKQPQTKEQKEPQTKQQKQSETKEEQTKQPETQPQQQSTKPQMLKPIKVIAHTETIDLVDVAFDGENVFSLTSNELICTNLKTLEHTKIQIDVPSQITCHKQGGVFAVANAFNVEIFNIKGFKFYDSFCLDEEVNILKWTLNGKQLVAACDNKVRIVTPKSREVTKVTGTAFHDGEITTMSLLDNIVFTGCIDGFVYASNISKGQILGGIPQLQATINTLCAAQNYLIVGPSTPFIHWYDSNKLKQLFSTPLKGSSTDIIQLSTKNQYAVGDIQGDIHLFDKRSPMEHKHLLKAGNTVHQLWYEGEVLLAACEDGVVRGWDLRKYKY